MLEMMLEDDAAGRFAMARVLVALDAEIPGLTGFAAGYLGYLAEDISRLLGVPAVVPDAALPA